MTKPFLLRPLILAERDQRWNGMDGTAMRVRRSIDVKFGREGGDLPLGVRAATFQMKDFLQRLRQRHLVFC